MLDTTPNARMAAFLGRFDAALAAGDIDAAVAMFGKDSYWRDLVAFTWNIKTMEGRDQVRDMLTHCLKQTKPRDWRVAEGEMATEASFFAIMAVGATMVIITVLNRIVDIRKEL